MVSSCSSTASADAAGGSRAVRPPAAGGGVRTAPSRGALSPSPVASLSLSGNTEVESLAPLAALPSLRALHLNDMALDDVAVLLEVGSLEVVSLRGNEELPRHQLDALEASLGADRVFRPERCVE